MPTNTHAIIRYHVLDRCFSDTYMKYSVADLVNECNRALLENEGNNGISRRRLFEDIKFMEDPDSLSYMNGSKVTISINKLLFYQQPVTQDIMDRKAANHEPNSKLIQRTS